MQMHTNHNGSRLPTHADVTDFLSQYLPRQVNAQDVPYLFHSPRHPKYTPSTQRLRRLILSVTPTPGFYTALSEPDQHPPPVGFLHRPWTLDRRSVPRGSLVLASHQAFDASLTVGWNTALGKCLGLDVDNAICIQGYKGDDQRKIGLVAKVEQPQVRETLVAIVKEQFEGVGDFFANDERKGQNDDGKSSRGPLVQAVAIMNAFHKEEIDRALEAAHGAGWTAAANDGRDVLYLTGAARPYGLEAAAAASMPVLCVGHRACEEWGIRYLARQVSQRWPALDVIEVLEEEMVEHEKQESERHAT